VIGLMAALASFTYLAIGIACARRTFRSVHEELFSRREPAKLGHGWMTDDEKIEKAIDDALIVCAGWPVFGLIKAFLWLITTEHLVGVPDSLTDPWNAPEKFIVIDARPERDGTDELIERLDKEINGMRVTHKEPDPWLWNDRIEVTLAKPGDTGRAGVPRLYGDASDTGRDMMEWLKHVPAEDLQRISRQVLGTVTDCPCGYRSECPVHCGDGHVTGACARVHREFM
jgi:hypothetical protein